MACWRWRLLRYTLTQECRCVFVLNSARACRLGGGVAAAAPLPSLSPSCTVSPPVQQPTPTPSALQLCQMSHHYDHMPHQLTPMHQTSLKQCPTLPPLPSRHSSLVHTLAPTLTLQNTRARIALTASRLQRQEFTHTPIFTARCTRRC